MADEIPTELFNDAPAVGDDIQFGFRGLAKALAGYALNAGNRTPFTVVIKGPWGRGKTTLLRATRSVLDESVVEWEEQGRERNDPPDGQRWPYTVEFNVWKYPDEDTILAGLLGALLDAMRQGPLKDQFKLEVEGRKGEIVKRLLGAAAPWLDVGELVGSRFDEIEAKRAFHDTFRSLFGQLWLLWQDDAAMFKDLDRRNVQQALEERQGNTVLAVFLDDLDRCSEERLLQTLQALNLFLDLPGVCFYVGVDWERVLAILEGRLGKNAQAQSSPEAGRREAKSRAEHFLDKIVQVAVDLPEVADEEAAGYAASLLEGKVLGELLEQPLNPDAADEPRPITTLGRVLAHNHPRAVKRTLNDLAMRLSALHHTGRLRTDENDERKETVRRSGVISLHLIREAADARLRAVLARDAGLAGMLQAWKLFDRAESDSGNGGDPNHAERDGDGGDETGGFWAALFQEKTLWPSLDCLAALPVEARALLVHHSAPRRRGRVEAATRNDRVPKALAERFDRDRIEMPGGTFWMGAQADDKGARNYDPSARSNESPVHEVTLSKFLMGRFPVTCSEYAAFVQAVDYPPPAYWNGAEHPAELASHPVVEVSWNDAVAYCQWLNEAESELRASLPTEAQWEFAARGSACRRYPWGDDDPTPSQANFGANLGRTSEAGAYPTGRSPEGVEDLAGNVLEWCSDWFGDYSEGATHDPRGPARGGGRVLRGGSFGLHPRGLRAAVRYNCAPVLRYVDVGFRVVWSLPEDS